MLIRRAAWVVGLAVCAALGTGISPAHAAGPGPAVMGQVNNADAAPAPVAVVQPAFAPITSISQCSSLHPSRSPDGGAMVCFKPDGEHLGVCDTKADGHHPVAFYSYPSQAARFDWHGGNGTCADVNLDIAEGVTFFYEACNYEGNDSLGCDSTRSQQA